MNENNITYADLKHLPSKKHTQKEKTKESIIYAEVNRSTSNSNQTKITRNKSSKEKASSGPFTWCPTVAILGIFCVFLLVTTGIWRLLVLQGHHEYQPQKPPLDNGTQEDNSMLKNITFTEEPLNTGYTLSGPGNVFSSQESKSSRCEKKWSCSREKCYYFSCELKSYEESRKFCKKLYATLPKIEDEKELKFIQSQLSSKSYYSWIGLSQKDASGFWTWEDNSLPSLPSLFFVTNNKQQTKTRNCARIAARKTDVSECSRRFNYICEKKAGHAT